MKLLTHNVLQCHLPNVTNGYPFIIEAHKIETVEEQYQPEFLRDLYSKIDWNAFRSGAAAMGMTNYPEIVTEEMLNSDDFLRELHRGLLEVNLEEGFLICPESGYRFSVSKGIPNLLLPSSAENS